MIRKVDSLGRIVLPAEHRKALRIKENDEVEIHLTLDGILIEKSAFRCVFCNSEANIVSLDGLCACRSCIELLYNAKDKVY